MADEDRRHVLWRAVSGAAGSPGQGTWGRSVCRNCVAALTGIDAAALTLRATASAQDLLGASADWAALLEDHQYTLGEGPGISAFTQGDPVLIDDLAAADHQWPAFTDAAQSAGVAAVFAFPLQLGAIALGTLDLYRRTPGALSPIAAAEAAALADLIALVLLTKADRAQTTDPDWIRRTGSYHDVHIATGMLAARQHISLADAFTRLRAHAFVRGHTVLDVARDVIARRIDINELSE
ncbi:ANTAR domain-containing protein [Rhodococcus sp. T2V]|uniref:ANTAR domain-containing protein n=1 Tax=Rhodococcus sp. T2V TaxID=3034164 RepID=UPI0023E20C86|nr:ANTAR domain-containing protein [Rhodococcus sp. T2V]MDF3313191.1 ANTAR domain-containing protein [Rhodococcus sp. T2V]